MTMPIPENISSIVNSISNFASTTEPSLDMLNAAKAAYEFYVSFRLAGFSDAQALTLCAQLFIGTANE